MNVNGITSVSDGYSAYQSTVKETSESVNTAATVNDDKGVVYEPTLEVPTSTYKANDALIARMKADAQARVDQLQNIVEKLISKQANAFGVATDMWNFLREGKFAVDPETKAQAEADIAEDGYYGVEQTSSRIIDFANALTGGDPSKIEEMREAFKKGFEKAEKTWGGKLPDICQKTYDAVMKKFDDLKANASEA